MTTGTGIGWALPTEAERLLQESAASGSTEAVLDALSRRRLHVMAARLHADTPGFTAPFPSQYAPVTGRTCVPVLTSGMLPPWHPGWMFHQVSLKWIAECGWHDPQSLLSVNPTSLGGDPGSCRPRGPRGVRAAAPPLRARRSSPRA
ncbi:hypothetical protein OH786_02840 [Streptomyces atratus]|uniref:Uncharacterized protein n=1 Tax=Streptomyces atratus TaxID=1893 RepID=A0A1K1ZDN8_STRAR|nr:hypothetical protein [Streptomyces atratus]SFX72222.1 hypothetical protein SAMN02787144_1005303 [Streptomyces atratus]